MINEQREFNPGTVTTGDQSRPRSGSKETVLVVDDDVRILNFVRISLRLAGYDVIIATSGEEALNLVDMNTPDIMLLDIMMSPMDGFEVLRRLRATSKLPVIAISAHASASESILGLGANDFMSKPFRPDELERKIQALLGHKR